MNSVTVPRQALLEIITANRDNHRALFFQAQDGYRMAVIEALDKALADARAGKSLLTYVALAAPEDHTDDYDTVIKMLEMSIDGEIEIDRADFVKYVRDKWDWSAHANFINTTYAGGGTVSPQDAYARRHT